jgi:GTP-binding protein YchF
MSLKCGIVGLPNVGKSTLFNALTKSGIAAENYPFCTIEPNVGIVEVPDPRMDKLAAIVKPQRMQPAIVEFVDIAGLVAGASKGEGLGNQFLANIRETDAVVHVVRCFADDNVIHVSGGVDPLRDIEVIDTELALADMATVEKALNRYRKPASSGDKEAKIAGRRARQMLYPARPGQGRARRSTCPRKNGSVSSRFCLITAKPVLYVANVAEDGFENNPLLDSVRAHAAAEKGRSRRRLRLHRVGNRRPRRRRKADVPGDLGLDEPASNRLIRTGYKLLGLQTYFTAGVKEVRAWTIHQGDTAPQAAGVIHTDFERGFIRAQTIAFDDFITYNGEAGRQGSRQDARRRQGIRRQDGDVLNFLFNV